MIVRGQALTILQLAMRVWAMQTIWPHVLMLIAARLTSSLGKWRLLRTFANPKVKASILLEWNPARVRARIDNQTYNWFAMVAEVAYIS